MFHRAHVTISAVCSVLTRKHCRSYGTESRAFIETLQSRLAAAPQHKMKAGPTSKRASVLVPFCRISDRISILYVKRSEQMNNHRGEVAFPGGMADETDRDPIHTALRETEEEIGVSDERLSVIGTHHEVPSKAGVIVTPVLAFIDEQHNYRAPDELLRTLRLNGDEIELAFTVAVEELQSTDPALLGLTAEPLRGMTMPRWNRIHRTASGDYLPLWGMTAYITQLVLTQLLRDPSSSTTSSSSSSSSSGGHSKKNSAL
jgi:8-oxo-dGTP pyrophosphatase MutT (NUDIX family)